MQMNEQQQEIVNANDQHILCLAAAASGKALPNGEIIPTPLGPRRVDEIKVGDYLFDRKGNPTKVLGVFPQGRRLIKKVYLEDGRRVRCTGDHLWTVFHNGEKWTYTADKIRDEILSGNGVFKIPVNEPVKYIKRDVPVDPLVYGAILGSSMYLESDAALTLWTTNDAFLDEICLRNNWFWERRNGSDYEIFIYDKNKKVDFFNYERINLSNILPEIYDDPGNIHIGDEYMYGSIEQRRELIRGFFAVVIEYNDMIKDKGKLILINLNLTYSFLNEIIEILYSLGFSARYYNDTNQLSITMPFKDREQLLGLNYCGIDDPNDYSQIGILAVANCGYYAKATCFYVDNNEHLFLTKDYVPTHNTSVLTERVRHLIVNEHEKPEDLVAITFTNLAAMEMKQRLGSIADGMYIGTIHGYANYVCKRNGINMIDAIMSEDFDEILLTACEFSDYEFPEISHLLVDEAQDISNLEAQFLRKIQCENDFYVGDDRQAIYGFKKGSAVFIKNLYERPYYKKYQLLQNYRNAPNILSFANSQLNGVKVKSFDAIPVKTKNGKIEKHISFTDAYYDLKKNKNYGSWFVLTRSNAELQCVAEQFVKDGIPYICFRKGDIESIDELNDLVMSNRVKLLTIHSSKGLQQKNVIVIGAKTCSNEERRISYVAATRAENSLYWCPTVITNEGMREYYKSRNFANIAEIKTANLAEGLIDF